MAVLPVPVLFRLPAGTPSDEFCQYQFCSDYLWGPLLALLDPTLVQVLRQVQSKKRTGATGNRLQRVDLPEVAVTIETLIFPVQIFGPVPVLFRLPVGSLASQ